MSSSFLDSRSFNEAAFDSSANCPHTPSSEGALVGTWHFDLYTRRLSWSEDMRSFFQLDKKMGDSFEEYLQLVVESERERVKKCFQTAFDASGNFSFPHRIQLKDGALVQMISEVKVAYDKQGQPMMVTGSFYDISSKKDSHKSTDQSSQTLHQNLKEELPIAKEVETLQTQLAKLENQKKHLLGFCNILSHNLRAPLANMSMLVEAIEDAPDEGDRNLYLSKLKPVVGNLQETFNELVDTLEVRQDGEVKSEEVDLQECVEKNLEGFIGQITKLEAKVELDVEQAKKLVFPPDYLSSILQNLISNALKYHAPDRVPHIHISAAPTKLGVLIKVRDNGLGIDLKKHGKQMFKIRQVFHRHPEAKGIGLYMTKTQVLALGGKIWVESQPNIGSTFFVEIPQ